MKKKSTGFSILDASDDEMSTFGSTTGMSKSEYEAETAKYIHSFNVQQRKRSRRFVRCEVCRQFPRIVRLHTDNNKMPPITTEAGTRFNQSTVEHHFLSKYHEKCKEAAQIATGAVSATKKKALIDVHVSEANKIRANHIGKLFIQVYGDAKKLTVSAYSWPARYVIAEAAHSFDFNANNATIPSDLNIQYVNPPNHLNLLKIIVQSHQQDFKKKIETARAYSIHIDGSVDRTQIDKIYILLKIVNVAGDLETIFIGIGQKKERGAVGLFEATKQGIIVNAGEDIYKLIMSRVSSICTDGENQNTGDKHSLWVLFEDECKRHRSNLPLTKLWCSAHRMELAWGGLTQHVFEVKSILSVMSSIATHFRESALRTEELKEIAEKNKLKLLSIPKIFKIRWTQWTYTTIVNVLESWKAIVLYCRNSENATATGFEGFLSNLEHLKIICFLADLLQIYHRYQQHVQSDNLTIVSLSKHINGLKSSLLKLQNNKTIGGWEERLRDGIVIEGETVLWQDIELVTASSTRSVSRRKFHEIRSDILKTLMDIVDSRFLPDKEMFDIIEPFIQFKEDADIRKIHSLFGADLNLSELHLEFNDLIELKLCNDLSLTNQIKKLCEPSNVNRFKSVLEILCRIKACTPQSADTERSIKANNLFKTSSRTTLNLDTENKYMHVYFNMPPLIEWNPRNAIITWLNEKQRRERVQLFDKDTAKNQRYYKGIFNSAEEGSDDDNEENHDFI